MKVLSKFKLRLNSPDTPRLYPLSPVDSAGENDDLEARDRSYDDALCDVQFSRFLHSEYNAQAPAGSYERLMLRIEGNDAQQAPAAPIPARPERRWILPRPLVGRLASGAVAVAIMAAALGPSLQGAVHDAAHGTRPARTVISDRAVPTKVSPQQAQNVQSAQVQVYDRAALLRRDPPDTLVPPRQQLEYIPIPSDDAVPAPPPFWERKE